MARYSYHLQQLVLLMFEKSKFRLRLWALAEFTVSHMLKHTDQVGFTTRRKALCSHPQNRVEAIHISISYTDKLAFPLPGRFPHEWMKCERFGVFADAHCFASQEPTETCEGVLGAATDKYATSSSK